MTRYPYAARLNSFLARPDTFWPDLSGKPTTLDLIDRAATVKGLTAVDINHPQQTTGIRPTELRSRLDDLGLSLNGYAMRYNGDADYVSGAFTNADAGVRQRAIDISKRGVDEAREAGGRMLTLWLGQDAESNTMVSRPPLDRAKPDAQQRAALILVAGGDPVARPGHAGHADFVEQEAQAVGLPGVA